MFPQNGLDDIDQIIVEGLEDYVDINNAALKDEGDIFILGGRLRSKIPGEASAFQKALSLGMTALNEKSGEALAAPIPDSPINREIHQRLVEHFKGRTNHGLRSSLAGMGLVSAEKKQFTGNALKGDDALMNRVANRAADRAMELIAGRQRTAGYPITNINIVGGHQIGRATSIKNEMPEQIMYDGNMEVEGAAEGEVRHEYRGNKAANLLKDKFIQELAENDAIGGQEAIRIIDALAAINRSRPRR